jgi:hypothetical protein
MNRKEPRPSEFDSPYINAPVWPWAVTGWSLAALFVLLFLLARAHV